LCWDREVRTSQGGKGDRKTHLIQTRDMIQGSGGATNFSKKVEKTGAETAISTKLRRNHHRRVRGDLEKSMQKRRRVVRGGEGRGRESKAFHQRGGTPVE